jgi:hypothetical protein
MDWTAFGAISTAVSAVIMLVAGILGVWQLIEMKRASQISAFVSIDEFLQEERVREARRILLSLKSKNFEEWTPEEVHVAELVCSRFDIVGIMIDNRLIKEKLVVPEWRRSIIVS